MTTPAPRKTAAKKPAKPAKPVEPPKATQVETEAMAYVTKLANECAAAGLSVSAARKLLKSANIYDAKSLTGLAYAKAIDTVLAERGWLPTAPAAVDAAPLFPWAAK